MSSEEQIDYSKVISDLKKEKFRIQSEYKDKLDKINTAIETISQLFPESHVFLEKKKAFVENAYIHGAKPFANMGLTEAILKLFDITNQAYPAKEIENKLIEGGIDSKSKKFYSNLYTTLSRLKRQGTLSKEHGKWSLNNNQQTIHGFST